MTLDLPEPDTSRLPRSPLELVVCQIRFDKRLSVGEPRLALAFHEQLGGGEGPYSQLAQIEGQELLISGGPGVDPQTEARSSPGWRFASQDGSWLVTLMPDHVALETTAYSTWEEDFEPRLRAVVAATAEHVQPALEQRLGLRYVDRIEELALDSPQAWGDYIVPELLGPLLHPQFGPAVLAAGQQLLLDLGDQIRAGIRHGPVIDGEKEQVDYLLDYDIFRQGGRPFSPDETVETAARLNRCGLQLFQASITEKLSEFLRGR